MERSTMLSFRATSLPDFVNPPDDRYVCIYCVGTLRPPVLQAPCGHRLCESCVEEMFLSEESVECPGREEDCEALTRNQLHPDRATTKELLKMLVYCKYRSRGCEATEKWMLIQRHEQDCVYVEIDCPNKENGCTRRILVKDLEAHLLECDFALVHCSLCDQDIPKSEMAMGHVAQCQQRPQKCILSAIGCPFEAPANEHKAHLIECVINRSKDITRHFERHRTGQKEIKEQVAAMHSAMENLQETVDSLRSNSSTQETLRPLESSIDTLTENLNAVRLQVDQSASSDQVQRCNESIEQVQQVSSAHESRITQLEQSGSGSGGERGATGNTRELVEKMARIETTVNLHDVRFAEADLRFRLMETAAYDGRLIWRIPSYSRRKADAVEARTLSLYSQPFYTSYYGYKMCARVYLNGDGLGKGSHLSLFFVLMRGEYDALLRWPFRQRVTLSLLDQSGNRKHVTDTFRPDPTSSSFRKPVGEMNIASGSPLFAPHDKVESDPYLKDDTIFICITIDRTDLQEPWV